MNAAIITIGEEILIGQVVDTNSAWIAAELNQIGIRVCRIYSISDSSDEIKTTINQLLNLYDLVITTGGIGPTSDDVTKQTLCEVFGSKLVLHPTTLSHITNLFALRGLPLTELNRKQAELPDTCEPLLNAQGTAPGMWFQREHKVLIALPGVPHEMQTIMANHALPRLKTLVYDAPLLHRTVHVTGLPESFLAQRLAEWEASMPSSIGLAYLPNATSVRLRLTYRATSDNSNEALVQHKIEDLRRLIPGNIYGFDNDTMVGVVAKLLIGRRKTLAVAESCTGGVLSSLITREPGASGFYLGGAIAYSNTIKRELLGVSQGQIEQHGAVSQAVVEAMARGALEQFGTDYTLAISGIAGPDGGTEGKPVGTVWIALASAGLVESELHQYGQGRERVMQRAAFAALNALRVHLLKSK